jgi:hypothetical protein
MKPNKKNKNKNNKLDLPIEVQMMNLFPYVECFSKSYTYCF